MKKMIAEGKQPAKPKSTGLSMAKAMMEDETLVESIETKMVGGKQFSKNPMINQILNETAMAPATGDGGFRTMNFGQGDMGSILGRTALAEKMGYGDMVGGVNVPMTTLTGAPVNPNNEGVQTVAKAMNRDSSELVKRFNKK